MPEDAKLTVTISVDLLLPVPEKLLKSHLERALDYAGGLSSELSWPSSKTSLMR